MKVVRRIVDGLSFSPKVHATHVVSNSQGSFLGVNCLIQNLVKGYQNVDEISRLNHLQCDQSFSLRCDKESRVYPFQEGAILLPEASKGSLPGHSLGVDRCSNCPPEMSWSELYSDSSHHLKTKSERRDKISEVIGQYA